MKVCTLCGDKKERDEFHANPATKGGLSYCCKVYAILKASPWAKNNRERRREYTWNQNSCRPYSTLEK